MTPRKIIWLVVGLQAILLGIELLTLYDTAQRQIALALTNVAAAAAVTWFDSWLRRRGTQLSWLAIGLVLVAVWLDALGNFQHLYGGFWWWDRVTHVVGGMAVSAGFIDFFQSWRHTGKLKVTWGQATWVGFLGGQFVASMYEVSEYLGDLWFHTQRVRGPYDTPHDLLNNLVGGVLIVLFLRATRPKPKVGE